MIPNMRYTLKENDVIKNDKTLLEAELSDEQLDLVRGGMTKEGFERYKIKHLFSRLYNYIEDIENNI